MNHKTFSLNKSFLSVVTVLLLFIGLNYANTLVSPFQFDDEIVVKYYPSIKDNTYFQLSNIQYRHIYYLSFALNYYWGELNPVGYHLFNILFHFLTTIIVFFVSFITIEKGVFWKRESAFKVACITTLFFALNPAHSETVTYLSGRAGGLAAFFYLLSLLLFILGSLKYSRIRLPRQLLYLLSLLFFPMAFFSKEISVTLPLAIILYDVCFMKTENWVSFRVRFLYYYIPFLVIAVFFLIKFAHLVSYFALWLKKFDIWYSLTQFKIVTYVIKLYYFPVNLAFDYNFLKISSFGETAYLLSVMFLVMLIFFAIKKFYQKSAILSFSVLWYLITISPTNSILPRDDLFSNRNLYLPSFGLSLFLAVIIYILFKNLRKHSTKYLLGIGCLMVMLSLNAALLIKRNAVHKTNISLWEESYKKSPGKMRTLHNLAHYYLLNNNPEKAFVMLKRLVVFNPSNYYAHLNLGKLYLDFGDFNLAKKEFKAAIKTDPNLPEAYFNLGSYYASKGFFLEAKEEYEKADIRYDWNFKKLPALFLEEMRAKLILNKAKVNLDLGFLVEAEKELKRYLQTYPNSEEASYLLGQIYNRKGEDQDGLL